MTTLSYEPLCELRREIRLAKLCPKVSTPRNSTENATSDQDQTATSEVSISLSKASLNDDLEFIALSYTWGDANDTVPITIDGCPFQATRNLAVVLRQLRQDDKTVTLWIDAICIQQSNNAEKSWQIQLMKDIYQKATTTLVWLGEDAESAEVMWSFSQMSQKGMSWDYTIVDNPEVVEWLQSSPEPFENPLGGPMQAALSKLLNLEYWFRVWCLQEFLVSQDIMVACGNHMVNLADFSRFALTFLQLFSRNFHHGRLRQDFLTIAINKPAAPSGRLVGGATGATRMLFHRAKYQLSSTDTPGETLVELLTLAFSHQMANDTLRSTDPRDRVFSLLNIASDAEELGIRPNYDKSCEDVFLETWTAILAKGQAALLVYPQYGRRATSPKDSHSTGSLNSELGPFPPRSEIPTGPELPSWVPDWRVPLGYSPGNADFGKPFTACGSKTVTEWVPSDAIRTISLRGVEVDVIGKVGTILVPMEGDVEQVFKPASTFLTEIELFVQESYSAHPDTPVYPASEAAPSLYRIPIGDHEGVSLDNPEPVRATSVSAEQFEAMLNVIKAYNDFIQSRTPEHETRFSMTMLQNMGKFDTYLGSVMSQTGRKPFLSMRGYVGLGPAAMEPGDIIVIFYGAHVPFVLRPKGQEFQLLGEAYVHGIMDGEFMQVDREVKTFHLC